MKISVYVDGSGGSNGGFGFFVKETGESFYEKKSEITNNQAEYMAIISALKKFVDTDDEITIFRGILQYYFLIISYDPYLASIISQSISTVIYMIVVNLTVKITRLYKDEN